jgi:hypothetical protein
MADLQTGTGDIGFQKCNIHSTKLRVWVIKSDSCEAHHNFSGLANTIYQEHRPFRMRHQ